MRGGLIEGVGIKDKNYKTIIGKWRCPYYRKWESMLHRCYNKKSLEKVSTYRGCSVCEEWLHFDNFRSWCVEQEESLGIDVTNYQLDKDILVAGNREYSPLKCLWVTRHVNGYATNTNSSKSPKNTHGYLLGVTPSGGKNKPYKSNMRFMGKSVYMGVYSTQEEAHVAYCEKRIELLEVLKEKGNFSHDMRAYLSLKDFNSAAYEKSLHLLSLRGVEK